MRKQLFILVGMIMLSSLTLKAQVEDTSFVILPDSSNFITASMIISSPGNAIYAQVGHVALRMECPRYHLDFCFSFEEEHGTIGVLKCFFGKTYARIIAMPTDQFIERFKIKGRQTMQYTLNLNLREKQELWRRLDNDLVDETVRHFNLLQNNCLLVACQSVKAAMEKEKIIINDWPEQFKMNNGEIIKYYTRSAPWLQFLCNTFIGTEGDVLRGYEERMGPELLPQVLRAALIVDEQGNKRPLLTEEKELSPLIKKFKASPASPMWVFGALLIITIIISFAQLKWKLKWLPKALDVLFMVFVTLMGMIFIYTSFVSGLFGKHWNWYLIPCNPLPLIIWLIWRKRKWFYKVYLFYTVVLLLFIIATPLTQQLDLPHQLITASLAVRCCCHYVQGRIQNQSMKQEE